MQIALCLLMSARQREIAGRLKASGMPTDIIAKNTGLSEEEVEKL